MLRDPLPSEGSNFYGCVAEFRSCDLKRLHQELSKIGGGCVSTEDLAITSTTFCLVKLNDVADLSDIGG